MVSDSNSITQRCYSELSKYISGNAAGQVTLPLPALALPSTNNDINASPTPGASNTGKRKAGDSNPSKSASLSKKQKKMAEPTAANSVKYVLSLNITLPLLTVSAETSACANGTRRNPEGRDSKMTSTSTSSHCQMRTNRYVCILWCALHANDCGGPLSNSKKNCEHYKLQR